MTQVFIMSNSRALDAAANPAFVCDTTVAQRLRVDQALGAVPPDDVEAVAAAGRARQALTSALIDSRHRWGR